MEEDRWRKRSREEEEIFKTGEKTRARYETVVLIGWCAGNILNGMLGSTRVPSHRTIVLIVSSFLVETR